jgi:hypothetical protein
MIFAVCLDPNSPNFNVNTLSSNGFSVYSDADNFTTPVAQNIPVANLLPPPNGNCPTLVTVPQGATQIIVIDQCDDTIDTAAIFNPIDVALGNLATNCCYSIIDLPVVSVPWCIECNIEFDTFSSSTVGRIIAGNLISSCGPVTDYTIGWYKDGDYSSPSLITGFGSTFNYQFTHPLTIAAGTAPMVVAGNYEGIIHDVIINGITYSSISGSANGTPIPFESCFDTVVAAPFECGNGQFPLPYTHQVSLTAAGNGLSVPPIGATYALSSSTDYFAYNFSGFNVYDNLIIKFVSGDPSLTSNPSLYSQPIYLENINLGVDVSIPSLPNATASLIFWSESFDSGVYPKLSNNNQNFKRVLSLTGLERTPTDQLDILVTPNPNNPQTSWQLKMQCLDAFDCTTCTFDNDPPYLIKDITLDRISESINPCLSQRLVLNITGCSAVSSDVSNYLSYSPAQGNTIDLYSPYNYLSLSPGITCNQSVGDGSEICDTPKPSVITFEKTNNPLNGLSSTLLPLGQIYMTFNDVTDYLHYKNNLNSIENSLNNSIGPLTFNCNDSKYYSGYVLKIPVSNTPNNLCGDPNTSKKFFIHRTAYPNIQYVENPGNNFWSITIPMPEVLDCLNFSGCTNCSSGYYTYNAPNEYSILNVFNSSSFPANTSNTISQTNNFGSKYVNPWGHRYLVTQSTAAPISYAQQYEVPFSIYKYSISTIPFISSPGSSTGWTILPSLGGTLCTSLINPHLPFSSPSNYDSGYSIFGYYFGANTSFPNLTGSASNPMNDDFKIFTRVIDNSGNIVNPQQLIYTYSSSIATVNQPQFFVGGNPTLTIEPF